MSRQVSQKAPLRERLYSRLVTDAESGCLLYTGSLDRYGYGVIGSNYKVLRVHRVIWELEVGPIPEGLQIDHVRARGCHNRNCANIAHLEPVTQQENLRRGGRPAQTECLRGHPFDAANTLIYKGSGARKCRTCARVRDQAWRKRKRPLAA